MLSYSPSKKHMYVYIFVIALIGLFVFQPKPNASTFAENENFSIPSPLVISAESPMEKYPLLSAGSIVTTYGDTNSNWYQTESFFSFMPTKESLEQFRQFNYDFSHQLATDAMLQAQITRLDPLAKQSVQINFRHPLNTVQFQRFVEENHLAVLGYEIWEPNSDGTITTIGGGPIDRELLPQDVLKTVYQDIAQKDREYTKINGKADKSPFKGFVSVNVQITDWSKFHELLTLWENPHVAMLTVADYYILSKYSPENLARAGMDDEMISKLYQQAFPAPMVGVPTSHRLRESNGMGMPIP